MYIVMLLYVLYIALKLDICYLNDKFRDSSLDKIDSNWVNVHISWFLFSLHQLEQLKHSGQIFPSMLENTNEWRYFDNALNANFQSNYK